MNRSDLRVQWMESQVMSVTCLSLFGEAMPIHESVYSHVFFSNTVSIYICIYIYISKVHHIDWMYWNLMSCFSPGILYRTVGSEGYFASRLQKTFCFVPFQGSWAGQLSLSFVRTAKCPQNSLSIHAKATGPAERLPGIQSLNFKTSPTQKRQFLAPNTRLGLHFLKQHQIWMCSCHTKNFDCCPVSLVKFPLTPQCAKSKMEFGKVWQTQSCTCI